jgi:hypothetical protein
MALLVDMHDAVQQACCQTLTCKGCRQGDDVPSYHACSDSIPGHVMQHSKQQLPRALTQSGPAAADVNMGICGDWLVGPSVEGAALSGIALAEKLAASMSGRERSSVGLGCKFRPLESHAIGDFGSSSSSSRGGGSRAADVQQAGPGAVRQQQGQQQQQQQQQQGHQQHRQQQQPTAAAPSAAGRLSNGIAQVSPPQPGPVPTLSVAQQIAELQAKLAELSGPAARNARKRLHKKLEGLQQGLAAA